MTLHIETPLIEFRTMSVTTGRSVWIKLDALQPPGSFKIRGIGHACETYLARGARRFISSSGGNAGLAVAYAGRRLGVPVTVVVPETTTERAKELLRLEKAEVIVHGASWQEANAFAQSLIGASDAFLHPFDDPLLWQGHATLVDEVFRSGLKPDAVVLSVGGGGLLSGVVEGLHRNGWSDIPVFAVETTGAALISCSRKRRSYGRVGKGNKHRHLTWCQACLRECFPMVKNSPYPQRRGIRPKRTDCLRTFPPRRSSHRGRACLWCEPGNGI